MTARQLELKRQGVDVVSMAAGEPDFDTPEHVKQAAIEAIRAGKTKYTPVQGIPELRETIAGKLLRENGLEYRPDQVTVSTGGKQALFNAFFAMLDPGDEVVIPAPFWVTYPEQVRMAGGQPVFVETRPEDGYELDPARVVDALTSRTRAIVLNSPGNPTGAVFPEARVRAVVEAAAERGIWVVSDEMYEHIVYDGAVNTPAARFAPDSVLTVNGASKAYSMTGWRIGYAAGPKPLIDAMSSIQGQSTSNASSISQWAALTAIRDSYEYIAMAREAFERRRDAIVGGLNRIGLATPTPRGAFYALADSTRVHPDEREAARIMLDDALVAVVPGTDFLAPGRVRLSYACSLEQIEACIERLARL